MSRRDIKELREKLLDQGVALLMEQGYHGTGLVTGDDTEFYQPMSLIRLTPTGS